MKPQPEHEGDKLAGEPCADGHKKNDEPVLILGPGGSYRKEYSAEELQRLLSTRGKRSRSRWQTISAKVHAALFGQKGDT